MNGPILKCTGVTVRFGGVTALSGLDLVIERGEVRGISGPNGAGKTTLFNAISGHVRIRSGDIAYEGQSIAAAKPDQIFRSGLARTFQLPELIETQSVEANVVIGAHFSHDSGAWSSIRYREAGLELADEAINQFGLASFRSRRTEFASLFERKLIMIASAYASRPKILLMDEPAGGLTDLEIGMIMEHIRWIAAQGVTIVIIEHVMRVLMELSDRVTILNQGSVLADGSPEAIRENLDVRRLYFGETV